MGVLNCAKFAEIIEHPLGSFGGAQLCEVARPKIEILRESQENPILIYLKPTI